MLSEEACQVSLDGVVEEHIVMVLVSPRTLHRDDVLVLQLHQHYSLVVYFINLLLLFNKNGLVYDIIIVRKKFKSFFLKF